MKVAQTSGQRMPAICIPLEQASRKNSSSDLRNFSRFFKTGAQTSPVPLSQCCKIDLRQLTKTFLCHNICKTMI
jgi:hypothetical protein